MNTKNTINDNNLPQDNEPTVDDVIQQLLDGDAENAEAMLANITDESQLKKAADLQLVHSLLLHLRDTETGRSEQRITNALARMKDAEEQSNEHEIVGRIGRFFASPITRWAVAASVVFAAIFFTANTGGTANASLERMIEAAAINADRTYLITHDIGDGPPPYPFTRSRDADNSSDSRDGSIQRSKRDHRPYSEQDGAHAGGRPDSQFGDKRKWDSKSWHGKKDSADSKEMRDRWRGKHSDGIRGKGDHGKGEHGKGEHGKNDRDSSRFGPRGPRPPRSFGPATLYVRGSKQFVLKRPTPDGEVIVGSNGTQSWIVTPTGPVYVSDDPRTLTAGPQGDLAMPFLNISEGLEQLKQRYSIRKIEDAPLPNNEDGSRLWHRLEGVKHRDVPGPKQMSIWADASTGIVKKVILNDFTSHRHRHHFQPRRILFDLQSTNDLAADWFDHTAHHDGSREVKTRAMPLQRERERERRP